MTNPFGLAKWHEAGWRPPTPHEVYRIALIVSCAIPIVGIAPAGSLFAKICELVALVCGSQGISAARNFISPQIRRKLEAVDARVIGDRP